MRCRLGAAGGGSHGAVGGDVPAVVMVVMEMVLELADEVGRLRWEEFAVLVL